MYKFRDLVEMRNAVFERLFGSLFPLDLCIAGTSFIWVVDHTKDIPDVFTKEKVIFLLFWIPPSLQFISLVLIE